MDMEKEYSDYSVEIDQHGHAEWSEHLQKFDDATLYQTWSYGTKSQGGKELSHILLKHQGKVVAMAQVRILRLPFINRGIAYVYWGPLWRFRGNSCDKDVLFRMLKAMQHEYVVKRKLLLRIVPNIRENQFDGFESIFSSAGFSMCKSLEGQYTSIVDLSPPLKEIRKRFRANWRNHLKQAEKNNLKVIEGNSDELFEKFKITYDEMLARKHFTDTVNIDTFRESQKDLPEPLKMKIMVCEFKGEPVSAVVCSVIGDTGEYLLGATNNAGMKLKGSYLLQWRMLEWLKNRGCCWYDLGGIDPKRNPGVYHFKTGFRGNNIRYIGQFESCQSVSSLILIKIGDRLRVVSRRIKIGLEEIQNLANKRNSGNTSQNTGNFKGGTLYERLRLNNYISHFILLTLRKFIYNRSIDR